MTTPLISVIIPAWQAGKTDLERCLKSLSSNDAASYEVILVDDGNAPAYARVLEEAAAGFENVRLIRQAHAGVSAARNLGTRASQAGYITFLDADDELTEGILDHAISVLSGNPAELLILRSSRGDQEQRPAASDRLIRVYGDNVLPFDEAAGINTDRLRKYYLNMMDPLLNDGSSWYDRAVHGRFLERSLALSVPFREDISFGEDVIWNFALLRKASGVILDSRTGYLYHKNEASVTQAFRPGFPEEVRRLLYEYRREISRWKPELRPWYDCAVTEYFTILCRIYVFAGPAEGMRERFMQQVTDPLWQRSFRRVRLSLLRKRYALLVELARAGRYGMLFELCRIHYHPRR